MKPNDSDKCFRVTWLSHLSGAGGRQATCKMKGIDDVTGNTIRQRTFLSSVMVMLASVISSLGFRAVEEIDCATGHVAFAGETSQMRSVLVQMEVYSMECYILKF